MNVILTFGVDVSSVQKATALRDKTAAWLDEDEDVTVTTQSMAPHGRPFFVAGVDTNTKEPFKERVEAADEQAATKQVVGTSKTRVVAVVQPQ